MSSPISLRFNGVNQVNPKEKLGVRIAKFFIGSVKNSNVEQTTNRWSDKIREANQCGIVAMVIGASMAIVAAGLMIGFSFLLIPTAVFLAFGLAAFLYGAVLTVIDNSGKIDEITSNTPVSSYEQHDINKTNQIMGKKLKPVVDCTIPDGTRKQHKFMRGMRSYVSAFKAQFTTDRDDYACNIVEVNAYEMVNAGQVTEPKECTINHRHTDKRASLFDLNYSLDLLEHGSVLLLNSGGVHNELIIKYYGLYLKLHMTQSAEDSITAYPSKQDLIKALTKNYCTTFSKHDCVLIKGLDVIKMMEKADEYRENNSFKFHLFSNNCSKYVLNILKSGSPIKIKSHHDRRWYQMPANTLEFGRDLKFALEQKK